jgi:hypothetical protein
MITINKAVVSRVPSDQVQAQIDALTAGVSPGDDAVAARLRDLAVRLAADRDLQVSVITYEDGRAELQVLHAGPPHYTEDTIDCAKFARADHPEPGWIVSLADDAGLQNATDLVRGTLLNASEPRPRFTTAGSPGRPPAPRAPQPGRGPAGPDGPAR